MVIWLIIPSHLATGTVPVILEWLIPSLVEALVFLHSLQGLLAEHQLSTKLKLKLKLSLAKILNY